MCKPLSGPSAKSTAPNWCCYAAVLCVTLPHTNKLATMSTVRFAGEREKSFVEVELLEVAEAAYAPGDALLGVRMQSSGFTGSAEVWVQREQLRQFCACLIALNGSLRGEARLESISPEELELKVLTVSSRGHIAVEGKVGRYAYGPERMYWHNAAFGFEVEQTQLAQAVQVPWIAANGG
jgi:hypothetical protein